jgi:hypothetical protein
MTFEEGILIKRSLTMIPHSPDQRFSAVSWLGLAPEPACPFQLG